jgi:beta-lactamase superfamily II metal-dependent hydrolase
MIKTLIISKHFKDFRRGSRLIEFARNKGVKIIEIAVFDEPVRLNENILILGPPLWQRWARRAKANETSLIVQVRLKDQPILLIPGDAMREEIRVLLDTFDENRLKSKILCAPHHGSFFPDYERFIRKVRPEIVLVSGTIKSCSPETIKLLHRYASHIFVTAKTGAIMIDIDERGVKIDTYLDVK